ncbi:hypothetical protein TSOC_007108 [Tetrabaena socialis]|uniref:Ubiquitin-like domain-containing protein n=1 Tax=Tetrabaena socialis TaxID=47790 RepID=A0A2J8A1Q7_9CHLO|nr:hypothetical protein TSOC_007108 [Tetrabaena socialis]|eukprot:PNH06466.1 hypothetical protein TSOC_007108 [Tetrabaena socialis]
MATLHFDVARADWVGSCQTFKTRPSTRFKKVIAAYESREHVYLTKQLTVDGIQRAWDNKSTVASLGIHEGSLVVVHTVEDDDEEEDEDDEDEDEEEDEEELRSQDVLERPA